MLPYPRDGAARITPDPRVIALGLLLMLLLWSGVMGRRAVRSR